MTVRQNFSGKIIGILGGGQLARMMILKAHELGINTSVLSPSKDDPAAQVCGNWVKGDLDNTEHLRGFLESVQVATFESEFLNGKLLQDICRESKIQIYPRPYLMAQLQDRLSQKNLFIKYSIPTIEFIEFKSKMSWADLQKKFSKGVVFKKRRFGYDGYGTFVVKSEKDYENFCRVLAEQPETAKIGFIAEGFSKFERELAFVCARNKAGQFVRLPLCETLQKDAKCFWSQGPVQHRELSKMTKKIHQLLNAVNYVGVFAVEMFEVNKKLYINEIAPRVHNTAHHSLNSMRIDQFTYHLLCILNVKLPQPELIAPGFAMINLVGSSNKIPRWGLPANSYLHWYGKNQNRPGRKMGHLNVIAKSPKAALSLALKDLKEYSL